MALGLAGPCPSMLSECKMLSFWHQKKELLLVRRWMYKTSLAVCLGTLALFILICYAVDYVGVKVTYVLVPVILISGVIAFFCSPSEKTTSRE